MRKLSFALLVAALAGCDPVTAVTTLATLDRLQDLTKETDNFVLINRKGYFYRSADHHNYKALEVYTWENCGDQAVVDAEVKPSCPNDIYIDIFDAEGTNVFSTLLCAGHCGEKVVWPTVLTDVGVPGSWRIELRFDLENVKKLQILIQQVGPCLVTCHGTDVDDDDSSENHEHPGTPYVCWESEETDDRDVEEEHTFPCEGEGSVVVDGDGVTKGEMEITICDEDGEIVHECTIDADTPLPYTAKTLTGRPGHWRVNLRSTDLTSQGLTVFCEDN